MRRKALKLRQFSLGGAKANSTYIGSLLSYFVVGDSHNNIRLYNFEEDEEIQVYSANSNNTVQTEVTAVALGCTEKEIFSGTNRGIINVWDMETAKANILLRGHSTSVNCFGINPEDPSKLASGSYDTMIKLWDIREKNNYATLKGHSKPITSISISPDGNMLLSGSEDNTARLWQLRYPDKPLYIANEHNGPILKVRFNPQDCMFATCSMDKTAKYFRCQQKCYGLTSSTEMVATPVTAISFSQDGKTLYTAANDVLKSWNMYKNGLLIETFDASWKGVQDMAMIKGALMGIAFSAGTLSLWVCDVQKKIKNSSQVERDSLVLPKIIRGTRLNEESQKNQISEIQDIVGQAIQRVNTIEERAARDKEKDKQKETDRRAQDIERKKIEMDKRREQMQRRKQEEEKKRQESERLRQIKLEKETQERQEAERKEYERKKAEEQKRRIEQEKRQQKLYQERMDRQKQMQQRVKKTLQENSNLQMTIGQDVLDNSSMMNISAFVTDSYQKEKMRQVELISDLVKDNSKYEKVLADRATHLMPILNYWKQGRINLALEMAEQAHPPIKVDFISTILNTPHFRAGITTDVGILFTRILGELFASQKHSSYVFLALKNLSQVVLMYKDQLIKIKTFNPLTRVDLSREERLAKYDKLIDEFLNVFRLERLKKYKEAFTRGDTDEKAEVGHELYKNLEEILIKIMPKPEPEPA